MDTVSPNTIFVYHHKTGLPLTEPPVAVGSEGRLAGSYIEKQTSKKLGSNDALVKLFKGEGNVSPAIRKMFNDETLFTIIPAFKQLREVAPDERLNHKFNAAEHSIAALEVLEGLPGDILEDLWNKGEAAFIKDVIRGVIEEAHGSGEYY